MRLEYNFEPKHYWDCHRDIMTFWESRIKYKSFPGIKWFYAPIVQLLIIMTNNRVKDWSIINTQTDAYILLNTVNKQKKSSQSNLQLNVVLTLLHFNVYPNQNIVFNQKIFFLLGQTYNLLKSGPTLNRILLQLAN